MAAGVLIDVDHLLDYYLHKGPTLKINKAYLWCQEKNFNFLFLIFHSLELVLMLWAGVSFFKLGIFWVAFALGLTQHLILDIIFNGSFLYSYSYFLLFRILNSFERNKLCRQ